MSPRPPCPECGERGVAIGVTVTTRLALDDSSLEAALTPGEQKRTWERRWQDAQDHLARLLNPRTEPLISAAIHAAHAELQAFYTQTYHLKDSLKEASGTTGVRSQIIENAITNDPDLALLADLANLDKHGRLSKKPRSGHTPQVLSVRGITGSGSAWGGWLLEVVIEHGGNHIDGLEAAKHSLAAWQRALKCGRYTRSRSILSSLRSITSLVIDRAKPPWTRPYGSCGRCGRCLAGFCLGRQVPLVQVDQGLREDAAQERALEHCPSTATSRHDHACLDAPARWLTRSGPRDATAW